jgi:hypothetical protein
MTISKGKTAIAITLFLLFAMTFSLVASPSAIAQEPNEVNPYPYINANPNPAQVGTTVLLHVGSVYPVQSVNLGWEDLSVIITRPDDTTETITGIKTDATGGTGVPYVPTMTGNYTLKTHFPEQIAPPEGFGFQAGPGSNAIMLESESPEIVLVVQDEPITIWPGVPLPTEYWTRPINDQIWEWSSLAGNWLGDQVSTKTTTITHQKLDTYCGLNR